MSILRMGLRSLFLSALIAGLGACGGGGGGGGNDKPTTPSTTTFPVAAAFNAAIINGLQIPIEISGKVSGVNVSGSGTMTYQPAVAATFEGQSSMAQTQTAAGNITGNGITVPLNISTTSYYDSNYNELGSIDSDEYSITTTWIPLPSAAHVNDSGDVEAMTSYTDQTKSIVTGYSTASYTIDADSTTSVILHVTSKTYDQNHVLTETDQYRYRIDVNGNISFVSLDAVQGSSTLRITPQ